MTKIDFQREVPHSPEQMFDLVSDLARYPSFVPNCSEMNITNLPEDGQCLALMHVSFGPINQSYESKVDCDREAMTVSAVSDDDPFSFLESQWRFTKTESGCHVEFSVELEIRNRFIAAIAEPLFVEKQREVVDAFVEQAGRLYGNPS